MPFWRSWAAAVAGASGAAAAVPVGLVVTVTVAAAVSGGGFGGLGQLTRGPEIPGVAGRAPLAASPLDGGLPVVRTPSRSPGPGPVTARAAATRAPATDPGPVTTTDKTKPIVPVTTPTTPTVPTTPPTTPTTVEPPTVTTPAVTTPARRPNPLREVVRTVQGVVEPLPLLGKPVSDAVGSVADLLLPPLPGRAGTVAGPPPLP